MRIYNKWYKELWFWIVENKEGLMLITLGGLVVYFCIKSWIIFYSI